MMSTVLIPALAFIGRMQAAPILPYSPHNSSSITDAPARSPACNDIHHCRTLQGIIFNCLATILACTWFAFHPDIPNPTYTLSSVRIIRIFYMLFSFLLPELTVVKAAAQCWKVSKYKSRFKAVHRTQIYFALMGGFFERGKPIDLDEQHDRRERHEHQERHEQQERQELRELLRELLHGQKPSGSAEKSLLENLVGRRHILDKSDRDLLGGLVAFIQTIWFIVQYIERWAARQPKTQLEVTTLAFVVINVIIIILWLGKPRDVEEPIDIDGDAISINTGTKTLREAKDEEWRVLCDDVTSWAGMTVFPVVGALFGGVHCFALWLPFPTKVEAVLWKVSAIYCTVFCIIVAVGHSPGEESNNQVTPGMHNTHDVDYYLNGFVGILTITGYVICRFILIVLTFISLRLPPSGIYEATNWTSFVPHFG